MNYYLDDNNIIRAIEEGQEFLTQPSWTKVTDLQATLEARKPQVTESDVKLKRSLLLSETDWYVVRLYETGTAIPVNVLTYRQALRDITLQEGYPENVDWPSLEG